MAEQASAILKRGMLRLGFGCGALEGGRGRAHALRLVHTAIDNGVTYFDTARLYGAGASEGILGAALQGRRDQIVVVSKAGILPATRSLSKRVADRIRVIARKAAPGIAPPTPAVPVFNSFGVSDVRASVERSLRELRTERLDGLLLHECAEAQAEDVQLRGYLDSLKREGTIAAYGIATFADVSRAILRRAPDFASIVQIPNSVWENNLPQMPAAPGALTVTHSALARGLRPLLQRLEADEAAARSWRTLTGIDPRDGASIAQLVLSWALRANPNGVVLFSTSKPENIAACVEAARTPLFEAWQLDGLQAAIES